MSKKTAKSIKTIKRDIRTAALGVLAMSLIDALHDAIKPKQPVKKPVDDIPFTEYEEIK